MLKSIAEFIEREAGHLMLSFLLIVLGAALYKLSVPKGEDAIVFALGVMARSMIGSKG